MADGWYISFTSCRDGGVYAWATETEPPRMATIEVMFTFPGEVHFAKGRDIIEARARLEAELPPPVE